MKAFFERHKVSFIYASGLFLGYGAGTTNYLHALYFTITVEIVTHTIIWIFVGPSLFKRKT